MRMIALLYLYLKIKTVREELSAVEQPLWTTAAQIYFSTNNI